MNEHELEQMMREGLGGVAEEAPAGEGLWEKTEELIAVNKQSRTRKMWTGGGLALAAVFAAVVATAAALHTAPAKQHVAIANPTDKATVTVPKTVPPTTITPTTKKAVVPPTKTAPALSPIPPGTVGLEVKDNFIYAVDATGTHLKTMVSDPATKAISKAELDPSDGSLWYGSVVGTQDACPTLMRVDLSNQKTQTLMTVDTFAVNNGRLAYVPCEPTKEAEVRVKNLQSGSETVWQPDAALENLRKSTGRDTTGGLAIMDLAWSPDGHRVAVSTCAGLCLAVLDASTSKASLGPFSSSTGSITGMAWTGQGLFLTTADNTDLIDYGATVAVKRYDATTLAPAADVFGAKDKYYLHAVAGLNDVVIVTAAPYLPGPPAGLTDSKYHLGKNQLYRVDVHGAGLTPLAGDDRGNVFSAR